MTWHRHGRYAYRSVRTEHGVQSQYVGPLHAPHVAATLAQEAQEQAAAAQRQHAWAEETATMAADEATLQQLGPPVATRQFLAVEDMRSLVGIYKYLQINRLLPCLSSLESVLIGKNAQKEPWFYRLNRANFRHPF